MSSFLNKLYKPIVIYIYILLLPITEIITTYMLRVMQTPITLGMIYKPLFLLYAGIYLIFVDKVDKKKNFIYLAIMTIYIAIHMCVTLQMDFAIINREIIGNVLTYLYFPIILFFLYKYYKNENILNSNLLRTVGIIYSMSLLIAYLINVDMIMNETLIKMGWFNSANELSAVFSITYPLIFFYAFEKRKIINFFILGIFTLAIISIGTRGAFFSFGITIMFFILYSLMKIIFSFLDTKNSKKLKKQILLISIISILLLTAFIVHYPNSSLYKTIENKRISSVKGALILVDGLEYEIVTQEDQIQQFIYNGRQIFLQNKIKLYKDSNVLEKIFGLKYKNQYVESIGSIKKVERDFHDIFYQYGILGFILFVFPMAFIIFKFIRKNWNNKKILLDSSIASKILCIIITLGLSYTGGHVLLMPSISILLAIAFISILDDKKMTDVNKQKKVIFISSVGGHLTQMLELKPLFNEYDYILITEKTDVTVDMKKKFNMEYMVYCSRQYKSTYYFKELYNVFKSLYLFIKYKPDVVITTGTHTAVPMMVIAKMFRKKGIYIESFAKRISPTLSGKFIYKYNFYTTFVVQWESMLKIYPKAEFWGTTY